MRPIHPAELNGHRAERTDREAQWINYTVWATRTEAIWRAKMTLTFSDKWSAWRVVPDGIL